MRQLTERLDGWRDEQIEFLARLVNHDSGTDDVMDVNRVGAILAERLRGLGFTLNRVATERFGDHLVAERAGNGPKRFLFVGHYDTVFPSGTAKQRPFRVDGQGRAWGPVQKVSVDEALRIGTINGAHASYEEHLKGSITPGKLADFVILEKDPHNVPPETIKDIRIVRTVVGGQTMYAP